MQLEEFYQIEHTCVTIALIKKHNFASTKEASYAPLLGGTHYPVVNMRVAMSLVNKKNEAE